jgi:hypothetical protein
VLIGRVLRIKSNAKDHDTIRTQLGTEGPQKTKRKRTGKMSYIEEPDAPSGAWKSPHRDNLNSGSMDPALIICLPRGQCRSLEG